MSRVRMKSCPYSRIILLMDAAICCGEAIVSGVLAFKFDLRVFLKILLEIFASIGSL